MSDRATPAPSPPNYYRILDIPPDADTAAISHAYRKLAKSFHPDRNTSPLARRLMLVINEAYEELKVPERRARYDRSLLQTAGRTVTSTLEHPEAPVRPAQRPAEPVIISEVDGPLTRRAAAVRGAGPSSGPRVLDYGRYAGYTINQIAAVDPEYLRWLVRTPAGRGYAGEVQAVLS